MSMHLYYSLIPEALIASMLTLEQFGQYYATGHKFKSKGQALLFEIDPSYRHPYFDIDGAFARCAAKPDGRPKNSVYISMYRVMEDLTVDAIGKRYLTTSMGATAGLERASALPQPEPDLHIYQDLSPINSLIVSILEPAAYCADVTTEPSKFFRFPCMCFVELELGPLARDPENGREGDPAVPLLAAPARGLAGTAARIEAKISWPTMCTRSSFPIEWSTTASISASVASSSTTRCSHRRLSEGITPTGGAPPISSRAGRQGQGFSWRTRARRCTMGPWQQPGVAFVSDQASQTSQTAFTTEVRSLT